MVSEGRWDRMVAVFHDALKAAPEVRAALLEAAFGTEADLRAEVEQMLAAHDDESSGLRMERRLLGAGRDAEEAEDLVGARLGAYRVVERIGLGGMGAVYRAERADDTYHQEVAIKVARRGHRAAELIERFRMEREILARLVHPNVAHILDGGVTADGRPYLAMRYVQGRPITEYCDELRLTVRQRLELFRTVCDAVQFAHGKLVVHRDLKPSNILVTDEGRVMLLDFGIAKLLEPDDLGAQEPPTRSDQRVLTPEFAAPEQLRGEVVGTAADVYGLGALLYRLLVGHPPHRISGRTEPELVRAICEEDPLPPSAVVTRPLSMRVPAGGPREIPAEHVAALRGATARELRRALKGDLDHIVLMAMRREPDRRYTSAGQLGEDVERFLRGLPVIAERDTLGYRARRFVGRHRASVAAAMVTASLLVGASVVAARQATEAANERDKAERVVDLMADLFRTSNPRLVPGGDTLRVADFLSLGEQDVEALGDQPDVQARMWYVLGRMHAARSRYDRAEELFRRAAAIQTRGDGASDRRAAAATLRELAVLRYYREGRAALPDLRASLERSTQVLGPRHPDVALAMEDLAAALDEKPEERARLYAAARAIRGPLSTDDYESRAGVANRDGIAAFGAGDLARARTLFSEADRLLDEGFPEGHPFRITVASNLASTLTRLARWEDAEAIYRRNLELATRVVGPRSAEVAGIVEGLGAVLASAGKLREAEAAFRQALAAYTELLGEEHGRVANNERNVGRALALQDRPEEAWPWLEQAAERYRRLEGPSSAAAATIVGQSSGLLLALGRPEEALARARIAARLLEPTDTARTAAWANARVWLGDAQLGNGDAAGAELRFANALRFRERTLPPDHPLLAEARCGLASARVAQGLSADVVADLEICAPAYAAWGLADPWTVRRNGDALLAARAAAGR